MGGNDDSLRLFRTAPHPCGYWPEREARDLVLDQRDPRLPMFYPTALEWGFRRSGDIVYRPSCHACNACIAVRIPVADFRPDRSQRRCLRRNADIETRIVPAECTHERLALYQRYLSTRHAGGGMDDHGAHEFEQFLIGCWNDSRFLELREQGSHRLLGVAVTDLVPGALSAVYTFHEPDASERGLGTLGILRQIEWARRDGRAYLYLGYWIAGHPKMDYKRRFRPTERFNGRGWVRWMTDMESDDAPG
ncbi:MAG: arginyltransferase [Thermomonas sp.]|uniref:arginyltransferase n=1 Tax=Thermomonas sp. TaxID=1971895 RepID=UPI0026288207|nr:arginyltransferase [Thermomonas sp.]MCC7096053.1 arginyltransferase [Thermomonas sp.]